MRQFLRTWCLVTLSMAFVSASVAATPTTAKRTPTPTINVYAAGSLRPALTAIAHAYEARTGRHVALTFGASGMLRHRIQGGADAQVFASADMGQPEQLARGGGWRAPVVFARSKLCLLTRSGLDVTPATVLATLLRPDIRIGTSTPGSDPSGDYTWQMFKRADKLQPGAYAKLDAKAMKLVGAGQKHPHVPAGKSPVAWWLTHSKVDVFVSYCNSAHAMQRRQPDLRVVGLPPELAVAAAYGMTVRTDAPADARQFAAALLSPRARQVFRQHGFGAP